MRRSRWLLMIPAVAIATAACSGKEQTRLDDALSRDLSLAATAQQPSTAQQYVSPAELVRQDYAPAAYRTASQPVTRRPTQVVYRDAPRPATRGTAASTSSGSVYSAPSQPVRHTKRDALIGVAAGTIAGAAIGKDAKGALIGAAAGGLLGAVVGHTIDVDRP